MSRQSASLTLQIVAISVILAIGLLLLAETRKADGVVAPAPSLSAAVPTDGEPRSVLARGLNHSVPQATGGIGTALVGGWASWYDTPGLTAAAGPLLRDMLGPDWRGQVVVVEGPGRLTVRVVLIDACACGPRHDRPTFLDLSREAFSRLGDPALGILPVSIEVAAQLPRTDVPDQHSEDPPEHPDDRRMRLEVRDLPDTSTR